MKTQTREVSNKLLNDTKWYDPVREEDSQNVTLRKDYLVFSHPLNVHSINTKRWFCKELKEVSLTGRKHPKLNKIAKCT